MFIWDQGRLGLLCQRREFLRAAGGLAAAGFVLPSLASTAAAYQGQVRQGKAKSCILIYLLGGPPHQDMFDLKPHAPAEVRGPFRPIATSVPGTQICEHLPRLARLAHRYALVRSVSHPNNNHTPMIYYTLTGRHTQFPNRDNDIRPPQRSDFPHMGSVVARFKGSQNPLLPGYVAMPEVAIRSSIRGKFKRARLPLRGGRAGFLGPQFDPLPVNGPPGTPEGVPSLRLPEQVSPERFASRCELLRLMEHRGKLSRLRLDAEELRRRAVVLTGAANRRRGNLFSLEDEPPAVRDRYGRNRFGQALLVARRLAQAGVPFVAIHFNEMTICDGWDLHAGNFKALQGELLPMLDQGLSALLEDLHQRGMLEETLVVCMGEFGRTPKINRNAGRDHWGECSCTLLAGGGVQGGVVHGASDAKAAYPARDPVDPVDIQATIYHCLGLDGELLIHDHTGRPWTITTGRVLKSVLS